MWNRQQRFYAKMVHRENLLKKTFATIFVLTIFISACSSSSSTAAPESAPAVTQVPATGIATEIPPTQPPTLSLPVSQFTPVPSSNTKITAENVQDLQEVAKYYGEVNYIAKLTNDKKYLFILDPDGLTKYDYASMESMVHLPVANSVSDMQISDDGGLLILDNEWLLDLKNDQNPKLHVLSEKIHLLNFYSRDFALSPDGTMIAVEQMDCRDLCEHIFRLVSTEDFNELFTSSAQTNQNLPTFSSDGKYLALVDLFIEAHPDGSTNPVGASVSIWTTSNFTKVSSFNDIKFPFNVTGIAFSEDNNLLAIAQRTSIDIYDVASGKAKAVIPDLCDSYERKVLFAPSAPLRVLEHSDCSSGEWTLSDGTARLSSDNIPNFSRIVFDEKGNFKAVPYTYPTASNLRAYRDQYYLKFLNNDVLGFKNFDLETLDKHSCDLSLTNGSLDCQSHTREYNSGRYLGKDVILATDGKYYSYVVSKSRVDIFSFDNSSQVYYSIAFRDYIFDLIALDPINKIVVYNIALSMSINRVVIQDMTNDRILEKWEGETSIDSIVFSENNRSAALCRTVGNYSNPQDPYKDRLVIFDLSEKRTIYNTEFNCTAALDLSDDGSKLAIEHHYVRSPNDGLFYSGTTILNTTPPYEKKLVEFDSFLFPYAVAFSPDGSVLAIGCGGIEICFFDASGDNEIYRLKAHSGVTDLAFSPDGSLLATSSDWGLISLWAVPPFTSDVRQSQSSPISSYTPGFSWNFDEEGNFEGWGEQDWQVLGLKDIAVNNGYFSATATDSGTAIYTNEGLGIDASKLARIEIRMKVSDGEDAQLYFRHSNDDMSEELSKFFKVQSGTEFHTYILDMNDVSGWKGTVEQLRLDPIRDTVGATVEIDYIHLLPPGFSWNFDEAGNLEGWDNWGEIDDVDVPNGYFYAKTIGSDPQIYSSEGLGVDAAKFSQIEIRMRVSAGDSAQLFFRNENNDMSENKSIIFPIEAGTEFKTYVLDTSTISSWKDVIYQLRLDPTSDTNDATIEIDYIRLLP